MSVVLSERPCGCRTVERDVVVVCKDFGPRTHFYRPTQDVISLCVSMRSKPVTTQGVNEGFTSLLYPSEDVSPKGMRVLQNIVKCFTH